MGGGGGFLSVGYFHNLAYSGWFLEIDYHSFNDAIRVKKKKYWLRFITLHHNVICLTILSKTTDPENNPLQILTNTVQPMNYKKYSTAIL